VVDITGCLTIVLDSLPYAQESITKYLRPGTGVLAMSHNWNGGTDIPLTQVRLSMPRKTKGHGRNVWTTIVSYLSVHPRFFYRTYENSIALMGFQISLS
jgi:hypothetical protein